MSENKEDNLITIIIPTADRHDLLVETLSSISIEVKRSHLKPILIVVDNASTPPVSRELCGEYGFDLIRYDERGDIGDSLLRTANLAKTEYVWVFGDDDHMCPGVLSWVFDVINEHHPEVIYLNRYLVSSNMKTILKVVHPLEIKDLRVMSGADAAVEFNQYPGFISSLVFQAKMFRDGEDMEQRYPGYGFLAAIYKNSLRSKFVYLSRPMLLQRRSVALWKKRWPIFWLISIPKMFQWLETISPVQGAFLRAKVAVNRNGLWTLLTAKAHDYGFRDEFWKASRPYLSTSNKILAFCIQYMLPVFLARLLYQFVWQIKETRMNDGATKSD